MTNKQLCRHIRRIRFNSALAAILLVVAAALLTGSFLVTDHCYNTWIEPTGESAAGQVNSILRAIRLRPTQPEGYHNILDIYLQDGLLTEAEDAAFRELLNEQQGRINKRPDEAAALYRRLAFSYITCYDANAEGRLKKAYSYFELTQPYSDATELEVTAIDTYLAVGNYFSEYIWLTGSLRQPTTSEIETLVKQLSGTLDGYQQNGADEERLGFVCCLMPLLDVHGGLWAERLQAETVAELTMKLSQQTTNGTTPVTARLQAELALWLDQEHPWEVTP